MFSYFSQELCSQSCDYGPEKELMNGVRDPFPARIPEPRMLWVFLGLPGH